MKYIRILSVLLAFLIFFTSTASALNSENLQEMTTEELASLREAIDNELAKREKNETFTVVHDDEYYATRQYIFEFLEKKGFKVQTVLGVPNIGRYEDENPDDMYVGWYAFVDHNGEWREYVVLLFAGEVVSAIPNKSK